MAKTQNSANAQRVTVLDFTVHALSLISDAMKTAAV